MYDAFKNTGGRPRNSYTFFKQHGTLSSDSEDYYCTENESYSGYDYYESFDY